MRACVTGATGLIGTALVRKLLGSGAVVQALVRSQANAQLLAAAGAQAVVGDVTDASTVAESVRGAEVVFHLAAKVNSAGSLDDFMRTNVAGTECVLQAAAAAGCVRRVIYASSIAVYGRVRDGERIDESTPPEPSPSKRDAYSHSKILAEQAAVALATRLRISLTVARPGVVYGPGQAPPAALQSFQFMHSNFVFGQPEWHFPLAYVENVVDALILAGEQGSDAGLQQFNIVDDDALTLGAYHSVRNKIERSRTIFLSPNPLIAAAAIFGRVASAITPAASGFSKYQLERSLQDRYYDTSKIRAALSWSPRVPLRAALEASLA
jgi:nucleoside-diphosphate-sugar epimerase